MKHATGVGSRGEEERARAAGPGPVPRVGPGRRRYVLALLTLVSVLNVVDRQLLAVLIEPIKREFGASDAQMGLLTGTSFALLHTAATLPIAFWADRGVRRTIVAGGLALWSGLTAATAYAQTFAQIFAIRIGVGVGEATGSSPAQSLLSDLYPLERRASALGILISGGPAGTMIAFALGGWLADAYGWRTAFLFFGIPGLILAFLIRFTVDEPRRGMLDASPASAVPSAHATTSSASLRRLRASPAMRCLVLGSGFNSVAMYAVLIWASPYLHRVHGLSTTEAGARLAIASGLCTALGTFACGPVADRLARRELAWLAWLPVVTSCLVFPFGVGFALASRVELAIGLLAPASFFGGCYLGPIYGAAQTVAGASARALSGALVGGANTILGLGIAPPLVGGLNDWLAPHFGVDAIRFSLALALAFHVVAAGFLWRAGFAMRRELAVRGVS